ncbi:MAG TPA: nicotinate phosphoribosyltransferase [Membranihabitans sp.]|nr:nicotinate phosphoribosyltransferase [Membranihabitans sp.]
MSLTNFKISATYTDHYQLTMAQVYFLDNQQNNTAVFDYYFRKLPFDGGYAVFAGLEELLDLLENLRFDEEDIRFLRQEGFDSKFLDYLRGFRFRGEVYSSREGDLVFPTRPILTVKASIIEAQIVETILLNVLNFQTLIATKARRIREVAGDSQLFDFGLRRAQGLGGYSASKACMIGGFDGSSNTMVSRDYGIPVSGTMAHSFIQNYEDELTSFRTYARHWPDQSIFLVDTYDTLRSGLPNAIKVGKELEKSGYQLKGIRLDSGDLAYLAKESRKMLDEAGLSYVKIAASNQLDEYVIRSLKLQNAPIDIFGVGTNLVIGKPDANLDGVYKLSFSQNKPRIKLSENIRKMTLPHQKQVYRSIGDDGRFDGIEAIGLFTEKNVEWMHHPYDESKSLSLQDRTLVPLLHKVMDQGTRIPPRYSWQEVKSYSQEQIDKLPAEYKRLDNPHTYKIGISGQLKTERDRLRDSKK